MSSQIVEVKLTASLLSRAMQSEKRNMEANGVVDLHKMHLWWQARAARQSVCERMRDSEDCSA